MEKTAVKIHRLYVNVYPQQLCAARLDTGRAFQQLLRLPRQLNPQIANAFLGTAGVVYLTRVCADRFPNGLFSADRAGCYAFTHMFSLHLRCSVAFYAADAKR